jgi:hypothetical protein
MPLSWKRRESESDTILEPRTEVTDHHWRVDSMERFPPFSTSARRWRPHSHNELNREGICRRHLLSFQGCVATVSPAGVSKTPQGDSERPMSPTRDRRFPGGFWPKPDQAPLLGPLNVFPLSILSRRRRMHLVPSAVRPRPRLLSSDHFVNSGARQR